MTLRLVEIVTPIVPLVAAIDETGALRRIAFAGRGRDDAASWIARVEREPVEWVTDAGGTDVPMGDAALQSPEAADAARGVAIELGEYFAGARREFSVPLSPRGVEYDVRVWEALRAIPYGRTLSYGELAVRLGNAGDARAVGRAAAVNPVPIVVPCHRLVGADGSLTGYAGGLDVKRRLLELEGALPPSLF